MTKKQAKSTTSPKEPRDARYVRKLFSNGEVRVFDTTKKGFVPLPIILRKLMKFLTAPQLRILVYLQLRASKYGLCFPSFDEMAYELGLKGRKNLTPHLKQLEDMKFISSRSSEGKRFYLVHDPRVPIENLGKRGILKESDKDEINQLLEDLKQLPVAF